MCDSYTESLRFSPSSPSGILRDSSSLTNLPNKRRQSTGILKSSGQQKKRRNVSFGGAHIKIIEQNSTSYNPLASENFLPTDLPPIPITVEEDDHMPPFEEQDDMELTCSHVFNIIQSSGNELTTDLHAYYKNAGDQTKEVAEMYRNILQQGQEPTGDIDSSIVDDGNDETMNFTRSYTSKIVVTAGDDNSHSNVAEEDNDDDDDDDDAITFKASNLVESAPSESVDETMNFTRSFTNTIVTQSPGPIVPHTDDIDGSMTQDDCTMDFTRSFTAAIITNHATATPGATGFLSPLRFPGASPTRPPPPRPTQVDQPIESQSTDLDVTLDPPSNEEVEEDEESGEMTMEFTRSFTSAIVAPIQQVVPDTPIVPKPAVLSAAHIPVPVVTRIAPSQITVQSTPSAPLPLIETVPSAIMDSAVVAELSVASAEVESVRIKHEEEMRQAELKAEATNQQFQLVLRTRADDKNQQIAITRAETELRQLGAFVGFRPEYLNHTGMKLLIGDAVGSLRSIPSHSLVMEWDSTGCMKSRPVLESIASDRFTVDDQPIINQLYRTMIHPSMESILTAMTHRQHIAPCIPHILHLLHRFSAIVDDFVTLRNNFTVTPSVNGSIVTTTISQVSTLSQVIVRIHLIEATIELVTSIGNNVINNNQLQHIWKSETQRWGKMTNVCQRIAETIGVRP